ncbi:MAG: DUF3859 domain-containing protein [Verrucomicrobiaceae bacterium]|nr:DUF3859 domain-containing protein [Verrucomicrobiaceae bacterium]
MKTIALLLAISTSLLRGIAQEAVTVTGAEVTEAGTYTILKSFAVPGAAQEERSFILTEATTNVPARLGTCFGFRYTVRGTPAKAPVVLTIIAEHPPFKNPKTGKTETKTKHELQASIGPSLTSHVLEQPGELVPGKFKFEVWHQDKKLCEQSFTIVPDTEAKDKK